MVELYWLSVMGSLGGALLALCIVLGIGTGSLSISLVSMDFYDEERKIVRKWLIRCACAFVSTLLVQCFFPSKTELYAIYGVGSVIDYAKGNTEVKKLPDNAVKALNAYLENITEEKNKVNKNREK